jgi:NAD-dependent SIR2 family protein deacetylase
MSEKAVIATFECASCGHQQETEQLLEQPKTGSKVSFKKPGICPKCKATGGKIWQVIDFISGEAELKVTKDKVA